MDILFVSDLFRPADFGGNRYSWEVTRRLARRHAVRVITPTIGGPLPGPTAAEIHTYPVSRRTPLETFLTNAVGSRVVGAAESRRRRPDVVMISSYDCAFGYFMLPPRLRVPSVYIYHSAFYSPAIDRVARRRSLLRLAHSPLVRLTEIVESVTFRSASLIVAVSPFSRRQIAARIGGPSDRVRVIPTGVDADLFTPGDRGEARQRIGAGTDGTLLLAAGRLAPVKRFDRVIDATARLRTRGMRVSLVIAGIGPEEQALRQYVRRRALDGAVHFAGFVDGPALRDHYRAADLVVFSSDFENWSLAALEALACGTPVVGTPRGSIPDLLGLVDDRLVAHDVDPASLAAAVADALADPVRYAQLARKGRDVVAGRFAWNATVVALERELGELTVRAAAAASGEHS